jgi:hypothetical protein
LPVSSQRRDMGSVLVFFFAAVVGAQPPGAGNPEAAC